MDDFVVIFRSQLEDLKQFYKEERKGAIRDNKTLGKQVDFVEEEMGLIRNFSGELEDKYKQFTEEFY